MLRLVPLLCDLLEGRFCGDDDALTPRSLPAKLGLLREGFLLCSASGDVLPLGVDVVGLLATVAQAVDDAPVSGLVTRKARVFTARCHGGFAPSWSGRG